MAFPFSRLAVSAVGVVLASASLAAAADRLPEGNGLSAKYPGDAGLARDRRVLFADDLKINFLWLLHYVTPEALRRNKVTTVETPNRVTFDHVVVATDYVGPLASKSKTGRK